MHPLLQLGPLTFPTYGLFLGSALLIGMGFAALRSARFGIPAELVRDWTLYSVLAGLLGSRILGLLLAYQPSTPLLPQLLRTMQSGGSILGGLVAGFGVGAWYIRRHRLPVLSAADAAAPGIALAQAVGRIGCLMAGCCYGRHTDLPWAITFTSPIAGAVTGTPLGIPLHPTQMYEAGAMLLIAVVVLAAENRAGYFPGRTFWSFVFLYGCARFLNELFRADPRQMIGAVSVGQVIAISVMVLSLAGWWWPRSKRASLPSTPA